MNKGLLVLILFVLFLLKTIPVLGLDLHTSIELALENNLEIRSENLSLSKEEIALNKAKKENFYPEIGAKITQSKTKAITREKDEEGKERKVITKTEEKPCLEINTSVSRPLPLGGRFKLSLKTTEALESSDDSWEVKLETEEPLSTYQRKKIKEPLKDEELNLNLAKLNREDRINEIIYQVIESYSELLTLLVNSKIKEKELKDLQDSLEISKLKVDKGIIAAMDIIQIELHISGVLQEIETKKKERRAKFARLSKLLGEEGLEIKDEERLVEIKEDRLERVKAFALFNLEDLKGLSQIRRKQIEIEQAQRALCEARSKNLPLLIPSYTISKEKEKREERVGLSLAFTLYDKGIKREEIELAKANLSQVEIGLKGLIASIKIELAESLDNIDNRKMRLEVYQKDIFLSEKLYEIARVKYERGLISSKDLLEYQKDLFTKESNLFSEKIELFLEYIKLLKITGRLYSAYQEEVI
ncbi:MAG: TolC family protein [bacterium]|nr:TolC family protein [bacterium]